MFLLFFSWLACLVTASRFCSMRALNTAIRCWSDSSTLSKRQLSYYVFMKHNVQGKTILFYSMYHARQMWKTFILFFLLVQKWRRVRRGLHWNTKIEDKQQPGHKSCQRQSGLLRSRSWGWPCGSLGWALGMMLGVCDHIKSWMLQGFLRRLFFLGVESWSRTA